MFWFVILGFLAAFGLLCAVWVVCGLLLPTRRNWEAAVYCVNADPIGMIRRFCRLRELGLTRATLTLIDSRLTLRQQQYIQKRYPYIRFCTLEDWLAGHRGESGHVGTGDGDPARYHRCGGVSEL